MAMLLWLFPLASASVLSTYTGNWSNVSPLSPLFPASEVASGVLTLKEKNTQDRSVTLRISIECGPWSSSPHYTLLLNMTLSDDKREGVNTTYFCEQRTEVWSSADAVVALWTVRAELYKSYVATNFVLNGTISRVGEEGSVVFTAARDDQRRKEPKVVSYCFLVFCVYLVLLMQMTKQNYNFELNSFTQQVSVEMLILLSCFDFIFSLWNIVLSAADMEANSYAFLAFIWVFTSFMMLRDKAFMLLAHHQELQWTSFQTNYANKPVKSLYAGGLVLLCLLFGSLQSYCALLAVPAVLCAVPQLLRNAYLNECCFEVNLFAACQLLARLAVVAYFFGCPANFLRLEPQPVLVVLLCALGFSQLLLLIVQMTPLGPRSIFPRSLLPQPYFYYHPTEEDISMDFDCAICMFPLQTEDRIRLMHSPCHHVFHETCLRNWMSIKMECPSCRGKLPRLEFD